MTKPPDFFRISRNAETDPWTVTPTSVEAEPGDTVIIKGPPEKEWEVWFDPSAEPHGSSGPDLPITIRRDTPPATYKFTVRIENTIIDPMIVIKPPPN